MYIEFNQLPQWAQSEVKKVFGQSCRPNTSVEAREELTIGLVWHEACRRVLVVRNAQGRLAHGDSGYFDSLPNGSELTQAVYSGGSTRLRQNESVLEILTYPRQVRLYVHPSNLAPMLPEKSNGLSDVQKAVLNLWTSYTSNGRKDAWSRYHVPVKLVEMVCAELADLGLMTIASNGSVRVTTKGKNEDQKNRSDKGLSFGQSYFYAWAKCHETDTKTWKSYFTGFAGEVIREYKEKRK